MPPTDRFVASNTFYIRYAETDAMGIVHHSSYLIYLEEGRSHYARQRGSDYADFERTGHYLTVTEANVRYLKPAHYGQQITVCCWISEMKSRALTFSYEVIAAASDEVLVTAYTRHICITHDGRVTRIPPSWQGWGKD